ncbi:hypothetical protein WN944_017973 [Citrus x changshan-huyou]|uniref:WUSCHEL-related homeobox 5 n=2 Tax=Citrus TaxID=2706 RepID=A0ACB8L0Q6_CITSI|nr:WUSCHEL-related homeobox 5 [Citrus sinensis]
MDERISGFYVKAGHVRAGNGNDNSDTGTKCGRWNPTSEQVKVLTDLFTSGLRTPSTDQIQKISTQLSFYGKIESKNVFYWFQNHKARERQKRRKVSVDYDHQKDLIRHVDKISSPKHYVEFHNSYMHVAGEAHDEPERVIETLQLFPLNSFDDQESEKLRMHGDEFKEEGTTFSYTIGTEMDHPPLDLRLNFL